MMQRNKVRSAPAHLNRIFFVVVIVFFFIGINIGIRIGVGNGTGARLWLSLNGLGGHTYMPP